MKIPSTLAKLLSLPAAIFLCILLIQACDKTGGGRVVTFQEPNSVAGVASIPHIRIDISETEYIDALELASAYKTDYCVETGKEEYCCDCLTKSSVANVLERLKTNKVKGPGGPSDDCKPTDCDGKRPDAIHVSQWVEFTDKEKFKTFLEKLRGNRQN